MVQHEKVTNTFSYFLNSDLRQFDGGVTAPWLKLKTRSPVESEGQGKESILFLWLPIRPTQLLRSLQSHLNAKLSETYGKQSEQRR